MTPLFQKLNLKDHRKIVVLNAPESFEKELRALTGVSIARSHAALQEIAFFLAFVTKQAQVDEAARAIAKKGLGDPVVWFAYPKQSSKRYTCEFNRDTGWTELGKAGFEPVRMVAIDEDWSAMRVRRVERIKAMKRDPRRTLSAAGRKKAEKSR
jgi:hypothetical protein